LEWEGCTTTTSFFAGFQELPPAAALLSFRVDEVDQTLAERVAEAMAGSGGRLLLSAPRASLELALVARRLGAGILLQEPLRGQELEAQLRPSVAEEDVIALPDPPKSGGPGLVGSGQAMMDVVRAIAEAGDSPATVLITGESGTGKELVARALHWASSRREQPFIAINCAAIPEHLLESELFGHERGAFTGAVAKKKGRFERAHGGTLFLDELGDMSLSLQAKILRALEEGTVEPVGGEVPLPVDVRLLAATNRDLEEIVRNGTFREDLFYRVAVVRIDLPPLRERVEDLEELALHFAADLALRYKRPLRGVESSAIRWLEAYSWPGNVRELRNVMDRAVLSSRDGVIRQDDLTAGSGGPHLSARTGSEETGGYPPDTSLERVEKDHIERVLRFTRGAMGEAAGILGIHRNTLTRKVEAYGIRPADEEAEG
jgi:DNA-binding NtrC family response regulator